MSQIIKKGKIKIKTPRDENKPSIPSIPIPENHFPSLSQNSYEPSITSSSSILHSEHHTQNDSYSYNPITVPLQVVVPKWQDAPRIAAPKKKAQFPSRNIPSWMDKPVETIYEEQDVKRINRQEWILNGNLEFPAEIRTTVEGPGSHIQTDVDGWLEYIARGGWVTWETPGVNVWWGSKRDTKEWKAWSHVRARNPTWQNAVFWELNQPYSFWHVQALAEESRVQWDISQSWVTDVQNEKGSIHFRVGANKSLLQLVQDTATLYSQKEIQLRSLRQLSLISDIAKVEIGHKYILHSPDYEAIHKKASSHVQTAFQTFGISGIRDEWKEQKSEHDRWNILSEGGDWNWKLHGGLFTMEVDPLWASGRKSGWSWKAPDESSFWSLTLGTQSWYWNQEGQKWDMQGKQEYNNHKGSFIWTGQQYKWKTEYPNGDMIWINQNQGTMLWHAGNYGKLIYEFPDEHGQWVVSHPLFEWKVNQQKQFLQARVPLFWNFEEQDWNLLGNTLHWKFLKDVDFQSQETLTLHAGENLKLKGKTLTLQFDSLEWLADNQFKGHQKDGWSWSSSDGNITAIIGDNQKGTGIYVLENGEARIQMIEYKTLNGGQPIRLRTEGDESPIYFETVNSELFFQTQNCTTNINKGKWILDLGEEAEQVLYRMKGKNSEWRMEQYGSTIWNIYLKGENDDDKLLDTRYVFLDNERIAQNILSWTEHENIGKHITWLTETRFPFSEVYYDLSHSYQSKWRAHFGELVEWELYEEDSSFRYKALEYGSSWYAGIHGEIRWESLEGPFSIQVQKGEISLIAGTKLYQEVADADGGWEVQIKKGHCQHVIHEGFFFQSAQKGFISSTTNGYTWIIEPYNENRIFEQELKEGFQWIFNENNSSIWDSQGWTITLDKRQFWQINFSDSACKITNIGFFWTSKDYQLSCRSDGKFMASTYSFDLQSQIGKINYTNHYIHSWNEKGEQFFQFNGNNSKSNHTNHIKYDYYQNSEIRMQFSNSKWFIETSNENEKNLSEWIIHWNGKADWEFLNLSIQSSAFHITPLNSYNLHLQPFHINVSQENWSEEKGNSSSHWDKEGNWSYSSPGAGSLFWPVLHTPIHWKIDSKLEIFLHNKASSFSVEVPENGYKDQYILYKFGENAIWRMDGLEGFDFIFGDWRERRTKDSWDLEKDRELLIHWKVTHGIQWKIHQSEGDSLFDWKSPSYDLSWNSDRWSWETSSHQLVIGGQEYPGILWSSHNQTRWSIDHTSFTYYTIHPDANYTIQMNNYLFHIGEKEQIEKEWLFIENLSESESDSEPDILELWRNSSRYLRGYGNTSWNIELLEGEINMLSENYHQHAESIQINANHQIIYKAQELIEWETNHNMRWKSDKIATMSWVLTKGGIWEWKGTEETVFSVQSGNITQTIIGRNYEITNQWKEVDSPQFIWEAIAQSHMSHSPGIYTDVPDIAPILTATNGMYGVSANYYLVEVMEDCMFHMSEQSKNVWRVYTGSWEDPKNSISWKPGNGHFEWKHGDAIGYWELLAEEGKDTLYWKTKRENSCLHANSFGTDHLELKRNIVKTTNENDTLVLRAKEILIDGKLSLKEIGFDWVQGGCGIKANPNISEWTIDAPVVVIHQAHFREPGAETQISSGNIFISQGNATKLQKPLFLSYQESHINHPINTCILQGITLENALKSRDEEETTRAALCVCSSEDSLAGIFIGDVEISGSQLIREDLIIEQKLVRKLLPNLNDYAIYPVQPVHEELEETMVVDLVDEKGRVRREIITDNQEKLSETRDVWDLVATLWAHVQELKEEIQNLQNQSKN